MNPVISTWRLCIGRGIMKLFTKHNHLFTLYFYVDNLFWYFPLYYVSNDSVLYMVANSTSLAYICKYSFVNYVTHSPGGECSIYVIVLDTSHRLYSVLLTAYRWSKLSINTGWRQNQYFIVSPLHYCGFGTHFYWFKSELIKEKV